jgi:aspartyl aminopeptidase
MISPKAKSSQRPGGPSHRDKRAGGKAAPAPEADKDQGRTIWERLTAAELEGVEALSARYRAFLSEAKTERTLGALLLEKVKAAGYRDLALGGRAPKGGYLQHHGKLLGLFAPGSAPVTEGFNLIVAHGDAPRLDLKPRCLYEDGALAMIKSNLYGGLKKFQWLARPLALWGFCALKDGRRVEVRLGEDPSDPVLTITDILPHLDRKVQREKKLIDAFPAEKLNVLAASIPLGGEEGEGGAAKGKHPVKANVLKILESRWGLAEDDLISSELELVPAGPAREVGLDRSMVGGYAQDDRLSVFCAMEALLGLSKPKRPSLVIIFDREEIGSYGSTGAETNFASRLAAAAFAASGLEPRWSEVQAALAKTSALSADVEAALDPTFKEVHDDLNAGKLGLGPCVVRYTGSAGKYGASEARAEYMAYIRRIFDEAGVIWQSTLLGKQEEGGGGTVAAALAWHGVSIVDCGAPVLSMHSPFEITSKADLWMTAKALSVFLRSPGSLAAIG